MKNLTHTLAALLFSVTTLTSVTTLAQQPPQASANAERGSDYANETESIVLQGKVKSIDKQKRTIVVVGANKIESGFTIPEEVQNFNNIKIGDVLTVEARQAIAVKLKKIGHKGIRERIDHETMTTAKPGESPALTAEKSINFVANVVGINHKAQTVTLQGPKRTLDLYVQDAATLKTFKVGDQIEGTYSEAIVIGFTRDEPHKAEKK